MPWTAADAQRHTKKADTPCKQRKWAHVANSVLAQTGSESKAIRDADLAVQKPCGKKGAGQ